MIKLKDILAVAESDFDVHCPKDDRNAYIPKKGKCRIFNTKDNIYWSRKEYKAILKHYENYEVISIKNHVIKLGAPA